MSLEFWIIIILGVIMIEVWVLYCAVSAKLDLLDRSLIKIEKYLNIGHLK